MTRRRCVRVKYERGERVSFEWLGFTDGGASGNLNTQSQFELIPPAGASGVIVPDLTVYRVVGSVTVRAQSGVTSGTSLGIRVSVHNVGGDQTIDNMFSALSSDPDDMDFAGTMYKRVISNALAPVAAADFDTVGVEYPIDIKVKRKMNKRDTLMCVMDAAITARLVAFCNLRVLIRTY